MRVIIDFAGEVVSLGRSCHNYVQDSGATVNFAVTAVTVKYSLN